MDKSCVKSNKKIEKKLDTDISRLNKNILRYKLERGRMLSAEAIFLKFSISAYVAISKIIIIQHRNFAFSNIAKNVYNFGLSI